MEGFLAGYALSGVGEVMLRKAHADPNKPIPDFSASAFDAGGRASVPVGGGWTGETLVVSGAHGCLWGADAGERRLVVYEGCGAAFELEGCCVDAAAVVK
jgi:hypothetical protein